ncbi:MAG: SDR family oxidoreductase [Woeseiaceae bacterium]|nr:SDR family oxidoreductase [Woeseiaceae bacterium]
MRVTLACLSVLLLFAPLSVLSDEHEGQKAVLITGASTGIGRLTAETLAEAGYFVYAGARKKEDLEALDAIDNIKAVRLDVTVQEEIDAAVELIEDEGRGLWGLVNNAGVNVIDPLIESDMSDLEFIFDVNVYGVVRVTKAFAPMIIESQGRIVNISSIAGVLAGGFDGYGFYIMSKHAIEAFSDQLAWEMAGLGVSVSSVLPGGFESRIGFSRCKRMLRNQAEKKYKYFAESMQYYIDSCQKRMSGEDLDLGPKPVPVARAVQRALFDEKPLEHYLVPGEPTEARLTIAKLVEEIASLNQDEAHAVSREDLLDIFDNEMRIARGEQPRTMPGFYGEDADQ